MTWIPDTEDKGDLLVSALGAGFGLAIAYVLSTRSTFAQKALKKSDLLSTVLIPGAIGAGLIGGHKLYESLEGHFETKRLLGQ